MYLEKFAVAVMNLSDHDNKLIVVNAENEPDAVKKAILETADEDIKDTDFVEWVRNLGTTYEEVDNNALQGDYIISNVIRLMTVR
jgi:hypothetical protein